MPTPRKTDEEILLSGVEYVGGCWLRTLGVRPGGPGQGPGWGYSRLHRDGRSVYAHRLAYETWVGPIPAGKVIDHLCRNRNCVNPAHLEPVTTRENLLRGDTIPARNAAKKACPRGHRYDFVTSQGTRWCRRCQAATNRLTA